MFMIKNGPDSDAIGNWSLFCIIARKEFEEWTPWLATFLEVYPEMEEYVWHDATQKAG